MVHQMPSERNYHSFYMLLAGATPQMRRELFLQPAEQFNYLNQSGCCQIEGRDELEEFGLLTASMAHLRLEQAVQDQVFRVLAGVLQLGNVQFTPSREVEGGSEVADEQTMQQVQPETAAAAAASVESDDIAVCCTVCACAFMWCGV